MIPCDLIDDLRCPFVALALYHAGFSVRQEVSEVLIAVCVIPQIKLPTAAGYRGLVKDKGCPLPHPCKIADNASPAIRGFCFLCNPALLTDLKGNWQLSTGAVFLPPGYKPVPDLRIHMMVFLRKRGI